MREKWFRLIGVAAVAFGMYAMGRVHGQRARTEVAGTIATQSEGTWTVQPGKDTNCEDQIALATQLLEVNGKALGACRAKLKTELKTSKLKLEECLPDEGHTEAMWFCDDPTKEPPPERQASPSNQLDWCRQELTKTARYLLKCQSAPEPSVKLPPTEGQAYDKNGMCKPEYVGLNGLCQTVPWADGLWVDIRTSPEDRAQKVIPEMESKCEPISDTTTGLISGTSCVSTGRIKFKTKPDAATRLAWYCDSPIGGLKNNCVWPEDQKP